MPKPQIESLESALFVGFTPNHPRLIRLEGNGTDKLADSGIHAPFFGTSLCQQSEGFTVKQARAIGFRTEFQNVLNKLKSWQVITGVGITEV
jgi:hypothetical protein